MPLNLCGFFDPCTHAAAAAHMDFSAAGLSSTQSSTLALNSGSEQWTKKNCSVHFGGSLRKKAFPGYIKRAPARCGIAEPSGEPAPMGQTTKYKDSLFDKAFMALFARKMAQITGTSSQIDGYSSFVDVSRQVMKGRTSLEQREAVRQVLLSILPPGAPEMFRKLFPPTKWSAEFNASITVPFFQWLVGPCEVVEVEVNGVKQKSGVHIKKCRLAAASTPVCAATRYTYLLLLQVTTNFCKTQERYIENSGCVGMCINMCKLPTEDFFTNEFGLPLTMNPNFEDMSCEMIYGQQPPLPEEDPAFNQPCYSTLCPAAQSQSPACPKIGG